MTIEQSARNQTKKTASPRRTRF